MHVEVGEALLDRPADLDVEVAREAWMDPALEANLRSPAIPGLFSTANDLVERNEVRRATQVRRQLAL